MKKIAAITMVRNDDFYLRKWVQYYSRELGGREHLYIYFDGVDQEIGDFCRGTNAFKVPKIGKKVVEAEKGRLQFLSWKAAELLSGGYDLVIGVDADEFIVVDPKLGKTLVEYLSGLKIKGSCSALGLDYSTVQKRVNELIRGQATAGKKSVDQIAREVLQGKWGNGSDRRKRLTAAGYDYAAVQKRVNELLR